MKLTAFLVSLVCIIVICACGLERYVYLKPPGYVDWPEGDKFTFRKLLENNEYEFRGFELYYKFYTTIEETDKNIPDLNSLSSKGFFRVCSENDKANDISKPLITISGAEGTEFDITIDFSSLPSPVVTLPDEYSVDNVYIRRGVKYETGPFIDQYKHFDYSYGTNVIEECDDDITDEVWTDIEAELPVVLVLYVLSYGKKDIVVDVYSKPVYIGEIEITF